MEKFDQKNIIWTIKKKPFNVDLNIEKKEELEILLKKYGLTKVQFLRNAINDLKSNRENFSIYLNVFPFHTTVRTVRYTAV